MWLAIGGVLLSSQLIASAPDIDARAIRTAMLRWRIGIDRQAPPQDVIETISSTTVDGRRVWRITHYPVDPAQGTYDLYDVDASTLSPIRSVMKNRAFDLSLTFARGRVQLHRTENGSTASETIAADGEVEAEGPGDTVFIAALPLKDGYTLKYQIVDRFRGRGQSRIKHVTLSVAALGRISTAVGIENVLEARSEASDGSFTHVRHVRAEAPHYPFRVEFTARGTRFVSEVTAMAIGSTAPSQ